MRTLENMVKKEELSKILPDYFNASCDISCDNFLFLLDKFV